MFESWCGSGSSILQIWESDSCSDFGYNRRSYPNLPMFLPKKWPHRLRLLPKWKSDSESRSGFSQIFDSGSGCEKKRRILPKSTSVNRTRSQLCFTARIQSKFNKILHNPCPVWWSVDFACACLSSSRQCSQMQQMAPDKGPGRKAISLF